MLIMQKSVKQISIAQELLKSPVGEVAIVLLTCLADSVLNVFGQVLIIIHEGV